MPPWPQTIAIAHPEKLYLPLGGEPENLPLYHPPQYEQTPWAAATQTRKANEGSNQTNGLCTYCYPQTSHATDWDRAARPVGKSGAMENCTSSARGYNMPQHHSYRSEIQWREEDAWYSREHPKVIHVLISVLCNPCSNEQYFRSFYLRVGVCLNHYGRVSAHNLALLGTSPAGTVGCIW